MSTLTEFAPGDTRRVVSVCEVEEMVRLQKTEEEKYDMIGRLVVNVVAFLIAGSLMGFQMAAGIWILIAASRTGDK